MLIISGSTPLLPQCAFTAWTRTNLSIQQFYHITDNNNNNNNNDRAKAGTGDIGTIKSNDRIAATMYSLGIWFVSGIFA
jgi:hypothetical protein